MNKEKLYFEVGDKVSTHKGNGEIVYIDLEDKMDNYEEYLVKIKGFSGHDGKGHGYINEDGVNDKWWFNKEHLEPIN